MITLCERESRLRMLGFTLLGLLLVLTVGDAHPSSRVDLDDLERIAAELQNTQLPVKYGGADSATPGQELPFAITMQRRYLSPYRKFQRAYWIEEIHWPLAREAADDGDVTAVDCYTELSNEHEDRVMVLVNRQQLPWRPCLLRIPGHYRIQFLQLNFTDPRTHVKMMSGNDFIHMPVKVGTLSSRTRPQQYGPFYVPCHHGYIALESYNTKRVEAVYFVMEPATLQDIEESTKFDKKCASKNQNWLTNKFVEAIGKLAEVNPLDIDEEIEDDEVDGQPAQNYHHDYTRWLRYNSPMHRGRSR
ncbi:hypothetical protein M3Y95_00781500 [Aphelenchoides besseyi]|nr:hypothetical protein M3Y95_00781500 [Aphelenchoides besseyi]